jgi:hypothetical protein
VLRDDDEDKNTRRWSVQLVKRERVRGILPAVTILQSFPVDPWMTMTKRGMSPESRLRWFDFRTAWSVV